MPDNALSPADVRQLLHERAVTCHGYLRADGHFDIEGEMRDHKTYDFPSKLHGTVEAETPYHHMRVRITITEEMEVLKAEAVTLQGPYAICPEAALNIRHLVGARIGPGWRRQVQKAIGGATGCTHITELLGPMATTAFQTIFAEKAKRQREEGTAASPQTQSLKNSCLAFAED